MFYNIQLKDHIRVAPTYFDLPVKDAVRKCIKNKYDGYIDQELGIVVDVLGLDEVNEGIIIPGDGASYYETVFNIITFRPELQEVLPGKIKDIADFGAFISLGPIEGMIHISQTMDDFVSFAESKVLTGKESKRVLKVGDKCRARVIAVSFKDITNPKLGLTMRQPGLGKVEWLSEEDEKKAAVKKETKKDTKSKGAKSKGAKK
jgi:DNA-directed RNA polymerase subunit E'